MDELGNQLAMVAGRVAWFVLILGIVLGVVVTRSIVQPVKELKRALYHMGRGVLPPGDVRVTPDEIGDMALAVNRLSQGLARTQKFSQEVGGGAFNTPYEPLSDDDALGKALLQMRSSLHETSANSRARSSSARKNWPKRKAKVENVLGDLQDSINYALRIQQAILPSDQERREVLSESAVFYQPATWFRGFLLVQGRGQPPHVLGDRLHRPRGAWCVPELGGHNALDRVTKVYTEPHKVLDHLNTHVLALLRKDVQTVASIPDDLVRDLALSVEGVGPRVAATSEGRTAWTWAWPRSTGNDDARIRRGQQPLYVVRGGELQELKPNKFAICSFEPNTKNYDVQKFLWSRATRCSWPRTGLWTNSAGRMARIHAPPLPGVVGGNGFLAGDGA